VTINQSFRNTYILRIEKDYVSIVYHIYPLILGSHLRYVMHKTIYVHRCFVARQPYAINYIKHTCICFLYYLVTAAESIFLIPFYLQAIQIHSANGVKLLEA
jgi:hypothetical protein